MKKFYRLLALLAVILAALSPSALLADHVKDQILDPPGRVDYKGTFEATFQCSECLLGPIVLNTDAQGNTLLDLTKLDIKLSSKIRRDVDLLLLTDFRVVDGNVSASRADILCVSESEDGDERCNLNDAQIARVRGKPIYIFVYNDASRADHAFSLTADWAPAPICRAETCLGLDSNKAITKPIDVKSYQFAHDGKKARLFKLSNII